MGATVPGVLSKTGSEAAPATEPRRGVGETMPGLLREERCVPESLIEEGDFRCRSTLSRENSLSA
jgi:hypothetical protein